MSFQDFTEQLDNWGQERTPFFFAVDFEMQHPFAYTLKDVPGNVIYDINGITNNRAESPSPPLVRLTPSPESLEVYRQRFHQVQMQLTFGNSYLTNLTIRTPVKINQTLLDLFLLSKARYKLLYKNDFLVFSPETFVVSDGRMIRSNPMKGTIDASVPDAKNVILSDKKEMAEHVTIVDLIRNDLSLVASEVRVSKFRYIDEIKTSHKTLLQVSSEITGKLTDHYRFKFGSILAQLLPAGSVSGAPKQKTLEIINQAEQLPRGFYTGVCGIFDGEKFDSGVMIRFIERDGDNYYYRSGGGITGLSECVAEYQEAIDKVYVPVD